MLNFVPQSTPRRLNLKICRKFPYIGLHQHIMQKVSAYLLDLECYLESFRLITRTEVLYRKSQSNNSYLAGSLVGAVPQDCLWRVNRYTTIRGICSIY